MACDELRKQHDRDTTRYRETICNLEEQLRTKSTFVEGNSHLAFIDKECIAIADVLNTLPRRVTFSSAGLVVYVVNVDMWLCMCTCSYLFVCIVY